MMKNLIYSVLLLMCTTLATTSDADWEASCGVCRCLWSLGKKSADCKNTAIGSVPTELSSQLQVIDLSNNFIPRLYDHEFEKAQLQNLHKLFIRNNSIQEIHVDALKGLHILIELDLSNNLISKLKPGTFMGLIKLRTVILNHNRIDRLEDKLFEGLEHLHKVEFKHNLIHRVGMNAFVRLPQLQSIFLDSNRLSLLKKETFQQLDKLSGLSLTENPWNCTCDLRVFRDFAIDRNLYTAPTSCHAPKELQGRQWNDVKSENFACRPRIIYPKPNTFVTAAKDNVTLLCRVRGSAMEIVWLFNKRPLNPNNDRIRIRGYSEKRPDSANNPYAWSSELHVSELTITKLRSTDKGVYVCKANNLGGHDEGDITFDISNEVFDQAMITSSNSVLLMVAVAIIALLVVLIIVMIFICCYCRRVRNSYTKGNGVQENGLIIGTKLDAKQQNESIIEGGSVIMEMQKSLLTEVNPVEKPPRRADIDANSQGDVEENGDVKRTLLEDTILASHDDETQSVALSDTTARSRQAFVEDGYGTNLPPDLLKFSNRFPQSPSMQSSLSNLHEAVSRMYGKSPLGSPIYHQAPLGYTTSMTPAGFRTLQHPRTGKAIAVAANRANSPFTPAPLLMPQTVLKQGYVTIPRKPRTPSWAPSANSTAVDFLPPTSPTSITSDYTQATTDLPDPIYDNLGMRTTACGYSTLELNKKHGSAKYTMRDRPLPATPTPTPSLNGGGISVSNVSAAYEPIMLDQQREQQLPFYDGQSMLDTDTEPLYGGGGSSSGGKSNGFKPKIVNGNSNNKTAKVPPRPPPKPKKKPANLNITQTSTSQLIEEGGDDGTEV